jgi:hypothetical protein
MMMSPMMATKGGPTGQVAKHGEYIEDHCIATDDASGGVKGYDASVLEADVGNEEADTDRYSCLQVCRYGLDDGFPDVEEGHHNEDEAFYKYCGQCQLP